MLLNINSHVSRAQSVKLFVRNCYLQIMILDDNFVALTVDFVETYSLLENEIEYRTVLYKVDKGYFRRMLLFKCFYQLGLWVQFDVLPNYRPTKLLHGIMY